MSDRPEPNWDINLAQGHQSELWVTSVQKALAGGATIEVKAPKPFLREGSFYVEYLCFSRRTKKYEPSGISTSKAKLFFFTFGDLPGGLVVDTEWLKRAVKHAWQDAKNRKECKRGKNPTKAVVVSLADLYATKEWDPETGERF